MEMNGDDAERHYVGCGQCDKFRNHIRFQSSNNILNVVAYTIC